jgi:hypothetical protein
MLPKIVGRFCALDLLGDVRGRINIYADSFLCGACGFKVAHEVGRPK